MPSPRGRMSSDALALAKNLENSGPIPFQLGRSDARYASQVVEGARIALADLAQRRVVEDDVGRDARRVGRRLAPGAQFCEEIGVLALLRYGHVVAELAQEPRRPHVLAVPRARVGQAQVRSRARDADI